MGGGIGERFGRAFDRGVRKSAKELKKTAKKAGKGIANLTEPVTNLLGEIHQGILDYQAQSQQHGDAVDISGAVNNLSHKFSSDEAMRVLQNYNRTKGYGISMQDIRRWQSLDPTQREYEIEMKIWQSKQPHDSEF